MADLKERNKREQRKRAITWGSLMAVMLGGLGWLARPFQSGSEEGAVRPQETVAEPDRTQAELEAAEQETREVTREVLETPETQEDVPSTIVETAQIEEKPSVTLISYNALDVFGEHVYLQVKYKEDSLAPSPIEATFEINYEERDYKEEHFGVGPKESLFLKVPLSPKVAQAIRELKDIVNHVFDLEIAHRAEDFPENTSPEKHAVMQEFYSELIKYIGIENANALSFVDIENIEAIFEASTPEEAWVRFEYYRYLDEDVLESEYLDNLREEEIEQRERFITGFIGVFQFFQAYQSDLLNIFYTSGHDNTYFDIAITRKEQQELLEILDSDGFSRLLTKKGDQTYLITQLVDSGTIIETSEEHKIVYVTQVALEQLFHIFLTPFDYSAPRKKSDHWRISGVIRELERVVPSELPESYDKIYHIDDVGNVTEIDNTQQKSLGATLPQGRER